MHASSKWFMLDYIYDSKLHNEHLDDGKFNYNNFKYKFRRSCLKISGWILIEHNIYTNVFQNDVLTLFVFLIIKNKRECLTRAIVKYVKALRLLQYYQNSQNCSLTLALTLTLKV